MQMPKLTVSERILELARNTGVLRPRDVEEIGIPGNLLARLARRGLLTRIDRGLYTLPNAVVGPHYSLAEATKRVPRGVICLISALGYHGLTSQSPFQVWMAIGGKDRHPQLSGAGIRIVRYSPEALVTGVETHVIEGVTVRIFTPAKTVADCFKYRNKIGVDLAIEALRDCRRRRACSMDDLHRFARICRVSNVMRPYLESVVDL